MATCAHCETEETQLHENGVPICLKCSDRSTLREPVLAPSQDIRAILLQGVLRATALSDESAKEFEKVMSQVLDGLPHPDAEQSIRNAARKLAIARNEMVIAHNRLNDYLEQEDVAADLKLSG